MNRFTTAKILLNARLAKMEERGASAVEYGLLVAGIAAVIVAVVFAVLMSATSFGRYSYAIGNSAAASRMAGVPVARTKIAAYKVPKALHLVEEMPRQPSGKPDYTRAKQVAEGAPS